MRRLSRVRIAHRRPSALRARQPIALYVDRPPRQIANRLPSPSMRDLSPITPSSLLLPSLPPTSPPMILPCPRLLASLPPSSCLLTPFSLFSTVLSARPLLSSAHPSPSTAGIPSARPTLLSSVPPPRPSLLPKCPSSPTVRCQHAPPPRALLPLSHMRRLLTSQPINLLTSSSTLLAKTPLLRPHSMTTPMTAQIPSTR